MANLNFNPFFPDGLLSSIIGHGRRTHPEEQGLNMWPHLRIATVLAQYISGIVLPQDVDEVENLRHDSLTHSVVGQCIVSLGQLGVRDGGACNDGLVVTEHVRLSFDGHTKVAKCSPQVDDLFGGDACRDKLRSVGRCLHCVLSLGKPINRRTIIMCRIPVTALPVIMSWYRFASS